MTAPSTGSVYDAIVVGAGPAGSTAAYELAGMGEVLVVDKAPFPRHKACGGALCRSRDWPEMFPNFAEIEADLTKQPCLHLRLFHDQRPWWEGSGTHFFDHVHRHELDDHLLRVALSRPGVSFEVFRLRSLRRRSDGLLELSDGTRRLLARTVVGADGVSSVVSRSLGNPARGPERAGRCCEVDLVCDKPHDASLVFYLWRGEPGYGWVFATVDGYYVGVGLLGEAGRGARRRLDELVEHCVSEGLLPRAHRVRRIFGALAPATVGPIVAEGSVLLAGDAARLLNQISGEGISYAMRSGQLAGRILASGVEDPGLEYRRALEPLVREVTYLRRLRPRLLGGMLSSYLHLARVGGQVGLGKVLKGPFVDRFAGRVGLPEGSKYARL
jgi:flavin-dependent dehydrogenase